MTITTLEGFWKNIDRRSDDECWEWKSCAGTSEYGNTKLYGKYIAAHRKAYVLTYGPIPDGMCVCHRCDNPPCCNPAHLFLGTNQDNVNDREQKGRNKMPHSLGEDHGQHKLTREDVREIRRLYEFGNCSYRTLASMFGVSFGEIRKIVKGATWSWLI